MGCQDQFDQDRTTNSNVTSHALTRFERGSFTNKKSRQRAHALATFDVVRTVAERMPPSTAWSIWGQTTTKQIIAQFSATVKRRVCSFQQFR